MKNVFKLIGIIALVAVIGFSITACDDGSGGGDNPTVDTAELIAVIQEADNARYGVVTASNASEVPTGRSWVTESVWNTFDSVYKTAVEKRVNPSSQQAVDTAKINLQASLVFFNAAKQNGNAAAITLSGTITVRNNGQIAPYVAIQAHNDDWSWEEIVRLPLSAANTSWSIITKPFPSSTEIGFEIYDNDKDGNAIFYITVEGLRKTVYNTDVPNININVDLNLITISGTFTYNTNRQPIPSVAIEMYRKEDNLRLGTVWLYNAGNNTPWSMKIPSQPVDTDVVFNIVGFDGPIPWTYDQLFAFWGQNFGVKVGNQNKTGIALNLITISGTVSVTYNGSRVPILDIAVSTESEWLAHTELNRPSANAPWSIVIPAFAFFPLKSEAA